MTHGPEESVTIDDLVQVFQSASRDSNYVLKLYVCGSSPRSTRAVTNIKQICEEHLTGRYDLEIFDLYQHPDLAQTNNVIAAPTLVRSQPEPVRRVIGDLSDEDKVLITLDIRTSASEDDA
jgi:circadian clock protein KaiB